MSSINFVFFFVFIITAFYQQDVFVIPFSSNVFLSIFGYSAMSLPLQQRLDKLVDLMSIGKVMISCQKPTTNLVCFLSKTFLDGRRLSPRRRYSISSWPSFVLRHQIFLSIGFHLLVFFFLKIFLVVAS